MVTKINKKSKGQKVQTYKTKDTAFKPTTIKDQKSQKKY